MKKNVQVKRSATERDSCIAQSESFCNPFHCCLLIENVFIEKHTVLQQNSDPTKSHSTVMMDMDTDTDKLFSVNETMHISGHVQLICISSLIIYWEYKLVSRAHTLRDLAENLRFIWFHRTQNVRNVCTFRCFMAAIRNGK